VATSLFDTLAARWTSNTLDLESDSPVTSNIKNSWSYLLEERKNGSPQQPSTTVRKNLQFNIKQSYLIRLLPGSNVFKSSPDV
jgi:hypothetical protein